MQINQAQHELLKTYFDALYDAAFTSFHSNFSGKLYKEGMKLFSIYSSYFLRTSYCNATDQHSRTEVWKHKLKIWQEIALRSDVSLSLHCRKYYAFTCAIFQNWCEVFSSQGQDIMMTSEHSPGPWRSVGCSALTLTIPNKIIY